MKQSNHSADNINKSIVTLTDLHHSAKSDVQRIEANKAHTAVLILHDPSTGTQRQYLSIDSDIYEVQSVPHARSLNYSSFFVGSSTVISEPHLHLVHRIDPLFFILPKFKPIVGQSTDQADAVGATSKWQPWNQLVETHSIPQSIIAAIPSQTREKQLNHLFQRSDQLGEDLTLYKFDEDKVLNWLKLKMERIILVLKDVGPAKGASTDIEESGDPSTTGAFSASFRTSSRNIVSDNDDESENNSISSDRKDDDDTISSTNALSHHQKKKSRNEKEEEKYFKHSAVQILCESLSPPWQTLFLKSVEMEEDDVLSSAAIAKKQKREKLLRSGNEDKNQKNGPSVESPSEKEANKDATTENGNHIHPSRVTPTHTPPTDESWKSSSNGQGLSEADKLLQYTMGDCDGEENGNGGTTAGTKRGQTAKSVALKRLEKVNTKGMKSMMSFFGAAVGKKAAKRAKVG